jgi:glyoxylase-like metal-dependent hydrolase (beta-lactamase superfamily II)
LVEDIREKSGAQVMMHHREQEAQGRGREDGSKALRDRFESWGLPQARAGKLLREIEAGNEESPWVQPDRVLHDEETIQIPDSSWLVVPTPGHTTGHICIADEDRQILFSGDHILPAGFPGLGLGGPSDSNPVSDYLDSLERISVYDHFDLVPGHGYHFRGLAGRRQNGRDHTLARAREVAMVTAAHPNLSTYELAAKLTWSGGWKQLEESFMVFSALTQTEIYTQFIAEGGLHRPEARARIEGD